MLWIQERALPVRRRAERLGNLLLKMFGVSRQAQNADQYYTSEELQLIVQESEELGALRAESGQVLQELFEFGDLTAGEVMVPRVRITGIPLGTTPEQIRELLGRTPHTRYPIYEGDLDHIVGMVHIKDLLRLLLQQRGDRPDARAPAAAGARDRAARRRAGDDAPRAGADGGRPRRARRHVGRRHARGSVRRGRRRDRRRARRRAAVYRDPQGRLRVPGTMRLDELGQQFDLELEHEDVDSVSGLILTLLGRPPRGRRHRALRRLQFEVTAVKGHGVDEGAVSSTNYDASLRAPIYPT